MPALIDGIAIAGALKAQVAIGVEELSRTTGLRPSLAVVLVGHDPASEIYVRRKIRQAKEVGITSVQHLLPETTTEAALLSIIHLLNEDDHVNGILVQLPIPHAIKASVILEAIHPYKDVDGFHPVNIGRISVGNPGLVPCTPLGCMMLLDSVIQDYKGLNAVVIGKSNIVGKPVALLLLERGCTVTVTHILTRGLPEITRNADIVIAAAGSPGLVRGDWVKPGAVLIDVGINRVQTADGGYRIVGDVRADEVTHAAALTPVPGGVGPMTVACLLANTLRAAQVRAACR